MSESGTTEPQLIKSLNNFTIDDPDNFADTTCYEDGVETSIPGFPGGSGTFSGVLDLSEKTLWKAAKSADGCIVLAYPDYVNDTSHYIRCAAWVKAGIAAPVKGVQAISGRWSSQGAVFNNLDT
jgi:hypothetical protein